MQFSDVSNPFAEGVIDYQSNYGRRALLLGNL
jgi:hypothetical protein